MPRYNEINKKVFTGIVTTNGQKGSLDEFLDVDKCLGLPVSMELELIKNKFELLARQSSANVGTLADMEEIIIQMRSKEVIETELRLSLSRNYIYARSLFFRRGKEINDIRVVVGKTEDYGDNLDELMNDDKFRTLCKGKLLEAMNKEIETNMLNYKLETVNGGI